MSDSSRIVAKLWSYCTVLRDDGLSYQDYLEKLTTLLFLKMADERAELTAIWFVTAQTRSRTAWQYSGS